MLPSHLTRIERNVCRRVNHAAARTLRPVGLGKIPAIHHSRQPDIGDENLQWRPGNPLERVLAFGRFFVRAPV
jgi:hypothetical protein